MWLTVTCSLLINSGGRGTCTTNFKGKKQRNGCKLHGKHASLHWPHAGEHVTRQSAGRHVTWFWAREKYVTSVERGIKHGLRLKAEKVVVWKDAKQGWTCKQRQPRTFKFLRTCFSRTRLSSSACLVVCSSLLSCCIVWEDCAFFSRAWVSVISSSFLKSCSSALVLCLLLASLLTAFSSSSIVLPCSSVLT